MRRMNRWRAPRWIRYWMIAATRMGDGWLWYGLGAMLLVYGGPQRFAGVGAAGPAGLFGIIVFKMLKRTGPRCAPCQGGAPPLAGGCVPRQSFVPFLRNRTASFI